MGGPAADFAAIGNAFDTAGREIKGAFDTAGREIKGAFENVVGPALDKTFNPDRNGVATAFNEAGRWLKDNVFLKIASVGNPYGCFDSVKNNKIGALCFDSCPDGQENGWGDMQCYWKCTPGDKTVSNFTCESKCNNGTNVAGVCWHYCPEKAWDIGALCRDKCETFTARTGKEYDEVLGVCWAKCGPDAEPFGALCREYCPPNTNDVLGVCWTRCNSNQDEFGVLCTDKCKPGFKPILGVCWGETMTYWRSSYIPKAIKVYDPGYQPPPITSVPFVWCNYGSLEMLDRMAQFYYDQSTLHPITLEDGRIQYEFIFKFFGVIASSELSCDVACLMRTVTYDPVTGDKYSYVDGASNPNDQGNLLSYRRFYFINNTVLTRGEAVFTVTGCTHADNTAVEAMVSSTDPNIDPVVSLPKIFVVNDKEKGKGPFDKLALAEGAGAAVSVYVGLKSGANPSMNLAGGFIGQKVTQIINSAIAKPPGTGDSNFVTKGPDNDVDQFGNTKLYVVTNNDYLAINHGPIYEQAEGVIPDIEFCTKFIIPEVTCTNENILKYTIDRYHRENPTKHIKEVNMIEPRGRDGCYYKWKETSYDEKTGTEGKFTTEKEIVMQYAQRDMATCVYEPRTDGTNGFTTDLTNYPVRSYKNINGIPTYPTRKKVNLAEVRARYVRLRPSTSNGDGYLSLSQVVVYDSTGENVAIQKPVYATSSYPGGVATPSSVVNGTMSPTPWPNYWATATANRQSEYFDIDLGSSMLIHTILVYGPTDIDEVTRNRMMGVRVQLLNDNTPNSTIMKEMVLPTYSAQQALDFTRTILEPLYPTKPFIVPTPPTPEAPLGGIGGRFARKSNGWICWQAHGANTFNCGVTCGADAICPGLNVCDPKTYIQIPDAEWDAIFNRGSGPAFSCDMMNKTKCQDKAQIDILVKQYNEDPKNTGKILKVLRGVTPAAAELRCDFEVEMLRTEPNGKRTVAKDTVAMSVARAPGTWTFNYTASLGPGTFITSGTPLLSAEDTSGGVFTFKNITKSVTDIFTNIIAPQIALNPIELLKANVMNSNKAANNLLTSAAAVQTLQGCPNTKCSDPGVLAAIMNRYNTDNNTPTTEFAAETNVMNRIIKAGSSGPNSCDVLFENLYEMYEDILYNPVSTEATVKAYRFPLTNIGNCQFQASSGTDVSGNAFGISTDASMLTTPFTQAACTVNCRDPTILRSVKQRLEARYGSTTIIPNFKSISQSFLNGTNTCEYQMLKDVATRNRISQQFATETDMTTYVSATFNVNPTGCSFTIKEATEYFPDDITYRTDPKTDIQTAYINNVPVTIPALYGYDETQPSPKVNGQTQILS
jgi:hypothetical protein